MNEPSIRKELILVADPMCSWCWGFAPAVRAIRENYGDKLAVNLIVGGLRTGNDKIMDVDTKTYIRHHWEEVSKASGQPFDFNFFEREEFVYDTEPACRACVTVRGIKPEVTLNYLELLHRGFYANNRDVTNSSVLTSLAVSLGIDATNFTTIFQSEEARAATFNDFQVALNLGVTGFPTIVAVDKSSVEGDDNQFAYLSVGYTPFEVLEPILKKWMTV
jgi:putative protein-disulfide isomerase